MKEKGFALCIIIGFILMPCLGAWCDEAPAGFVLVKAGTFTMGSPESEPGRWYFETQHIVTVSHNYYMSKYEVTQEEWIAVMGRNPSSFKGDNRPVENVSWYDVVEYCNRRSKKEGLTPCYAGSGDTIDCDFAADGYRLPTEAEWEYAARGGHKAVSYKVYAGSDNVDEVAWYNDNSGGKSHPVGGKQPNELGLYDMTGNVDEWCWDRFDCEDYPTESVNDPSGTTSGRFRVFRGGSWVSFENACRSASRTSDIPSGSDSILGFRVVRRP